MTSDPDTDPSAVDATIVSYECRVSGVKHPIPSADTRVMKIGDGGFVIACACSSEPLSETDTAPHPTDDHLVNVYGADPSPEDWLRLEALADGWFETTRWHSPDGWEGTHGQRRHDFSQQVESIADRDDGRSLEPTPAQQRALEVACPDCGASAGRKCKRPSGHRVRTPHQDRVDDAAPDEPPSTQSTQQAAIDRW